MTDVTDAPTKPRYRMRAWGGGLPELNYEDGDYPTDLASRGYTYIYIQRLDPIPLGIVLAALKS